MRNIEKLPTWMGDIVREKKLPIDLNNVEE